VSVGTLEYIYSRLEQEPEIWAAGCRVLNSDGTFQVACRRGFPTVWNSFCKLFGLQSLFPSNPIFSGYNKLYLSDRDEYEIEAIIGAFMFFRADKLKSLGGFDPDFFMYGEDLDLCKRVWDNGGKIKYYPDTEIIHHKGESTKRSDINSLKHFYEAMNIYTRKHTSNSFWMLALLRAAISFRSSIAFMIKHRFDIGVLCVDAVILMISALFSTWYVKGEMFNFPDWAYPDVFVTLLFVHFLSFFMAGVYFEKAMSAARAIPGILLSFLVLSSLTYYFNEYAFSRGVILLTLLVGGTAILLYKAFLSSSSWLDKTKKGLLVPTEYLQDANLIKVAAIRGLEIIPQDEDNFSDLRHDAIVIGNNLSDKSYSKETFIADALLENTIGPSHQSFNINLPRFRFFKRLSDMFVAFLMLTLLLPLTIILGKTRSALMMFIGEISLVGVVHSKKHKFAFSKAGLTDIAKAYGLENLSESEIHELNLKYLRDYTLVKDIELLLQTLLLKRKRV